MGFGLVIGFIELLHNVTTNNYDSIVELHTPNITVTTGHIKSSLVVVWYWILTISSASVFMLLPAGDCLTSNSLLQLSCL
jgi:hypothetical protein